MNWDEIRAQYPHCWLVAEATQAYTEGGHRIIEQLEVTEAFASDWKEAWECYKSLHQADKTREYYVLHTDRPQLDIEVLDAFGRNMPS